jgi:hypothetical protein
MTIISATDTRAPEYEGINFLISTATIDTSSYLGFYDVMASIYSL